MNANKKMEQEIQKLQQDETYTFTSQFPPINQKEYQKINDERELRCKKRGAQIEDLTFYIKYAKDLTEANFSHCRLTLQEKNSLLAAYQWRKDHQNSLHLEPMTLLFRIPSTLFVLSKSEERKLQEHEKMADHQENNALNQRIINRLRHTVKFSIFAKIRLAPLKPVSIFHNSIERKY